MQQLIPNVQRIGIGRFFSVYANRIRVTTRINANVNLNFARLIRVRQQPAHKCSTLSGLLDTGIDTLQAGNPFLVGGGVKSSWAKTAVVWLGRVREYCRSSPGKVGVVAFHTTYSVEALVSVKCFRSSARSFVS